MTQEELKKIQVISRAVDGVITVNKAAELLKLSTRRVKQLKAGYRKIGAKSCIHASRGKDSCKRTDPSIIAQIVQLRRKKPYISSNYMHFRELVAEELGINIGYQTLRRICIKAKLKSPKTQRPRKAKHKTRARRELLGMMLQADGSPFDWLSTGKQICLQGFIDDALGIITGLYFTEHECLLGYIEVLRQTLTNYGIPMSLLPDRYSVFFVNPKKESDVSIEEQLAGQEKRVTQFGRMVNELGIAMHPAHSPQSKGRIERLWQTLQSRLPVELARRGIKTIEQANAFLPEFIKQYNKQFGLKPHTDATAFIPITKDQIDTCLCAQFTRQIDCGRMISFNNLKFRAECNTLPRKAKITLLLDYQHGFRGMYNGELFPIVPLDEHNREIISTDSCNVPEVLKSFFEKLFFADAKRA